MSGFLPFCQYLTICQYAIYGMIFACNSVYMLDYQYIALFFNVCRLWHAVCSSIDKHGKTQGHKKRYI